MHTCLCEHCTLMHTTPILLFRVGDMLLLLIYTSTAAAALLPACQRCSPLHQLPTCSTTSPVLGQGHRCVQQENSASPAAGNTALHARACCCCWCGSAGQACEGVNSAALLAYQAHPLLLLLLLSWGPRCTCRRPLLPATARIAGAAATAHQARAGAR